MNLSVGHQEDFFHIRNVFAVFCIMRLNENEPKIIYRREKEKGVIDERKKTMAPIQNRLKIQCQRMSPF